MKFACKSLRIINILLLSPIAAVIHVVYILPAWALGLLRPAGVLDGQVIRWNVQHGRWRLWDRLWRGWAGHTLPFAIVIVPEATFETVRHELRHHCQWLTLGPLFVVVYLALLPFTGYRNHPLEQDARRAARLN